MDSPFNDAGRPGLSRVQSREVDRLAMERFGLGGLVLMENAGLLAALRCMDLRQGPGAVIVLCGKGNNGGDGFVLARQLALRGVPVQVLALGGPGECSPDAGIQRRILDASGQAVLEVSSAEERRGAWRGWDGCSLIVDALLGTGFCGELREGVRELLAAVTTYKESADCRVVALDLPSGMDCDSGLAAEGCVAADLTLSFAARKLAFDKPESESWTGQVEVLPIGAPRAVFEALWSSFKPES